MALGIRGANPIWSEVNLTGKLFDDTYYMWVLENEIPYIPATVYHDPDLNTPWTNPIQFLGNGTLPVDIFFESEVVYRLEFRQHLNPLTPPTQSDPLIYLVENYVAGEGGSSPIDTVAITSSNQITNSQFEVVNFVSPYTLSGTNPDPIQIGPGWFLIATGTGSVTINQVPLNNSVSTPTNAPYALRLTLSGWTTGSVFLVQRFYQNGVLWANKYVSTALTAEVTGSNVNISATLVDSQGTTLATILPPSPVTPIFSELTNNGQLMGSTNTDTPPAAYIDYKLSIPSNADIYVTSIQVVVQDLPISPSFVQDSINRQLDYTFHYYMPQLAFKPIPSLLTGWDFPLNPNQFGITSFGTTPIYVWDQTICGSVVGTVNVGRLATTDAMQFTTNNANEAFFMLQYLSGAEAVKTTMSNLSVLIDAYSLVHSGVKVQAFLYYSSAGGTIPVLSGSPATIGTLAANGIFTINGTTGANWTLVPQFNGFTNVNTLASSASAATDIAFSGFNGGTNFASSSAHNFAIVVTFSVPTSGTTIQVNSISCVPGDIATRPAPQTRDAVLRECQRYWIKSFVPGQAPASSIALGASYGIWEINGGTDLGGNIIVNFPSPMRATPGTPTLYNPVASGGQMYNFTRGASTTGVSVTNISQQGFIVIGTGVFPVGVFDLVGIQWTTDSRYGIV